MDVADVDRMVCAKCLTSKSCTMRNGRSIGKYNKGHRTPLDCSVVQTWLATMDVDLVHHDVPKEMMNHD